VEVFQKALVAKNLISQDLATRSTTGPGRFQDLELMQDEFDEAYEGKREEFKMALIEARDYLGRLLAKTWSSLRPPNFLSYHDVLRALLRADRDAAVSGGKHQDTIRACFAWRGINLLPTSFLMRPRTLRECGLLPAPLRAAEPGSDAPAAASTTRNAEARGQANYRKVKPKATAAKKKKKR
jgi:hypothetical protein